MAGYASGLSYDRLREIADAGSIESLSKGTVRKHGGKWQAVISFQRLDPDSETGTTQAFITHTLDARCSGRGAMSKPQALKMVIAWRAQVIEDAKQVAGIAADPTRTVRECVNAYIDGKESIGEIRRSTGTYYRNAAKRLFRYPLASMPLQAVSKPMVQAMVADMSKSLAGKTVKATVDILDATCREMLGHDANPCAGVKLPRIAHNAKSRSSRPNALSFDGVARMNSLLDERESRYDGIDNVAVGARIALHTGMRAEEVCGLRWRDVDLANRTIHVCNVIERAEIPVRDEHGNIIRNADGSAKVTYEQYDAEPKTKGSERDIPLTDGLAELLTRHKRNVLTLIAEMVPSKDERPNIGALYVVGGIDGRHMSPHRLGVNWAKFARSRNLIGTEGKAVTFHDLRHTCATRMIAAGIDVATVSRILGHAEISVTLAKYVTSDAATQRAAMERMGEVFSMREPDQTEGVIPFRTGTSG